MVLRVGVLGAGVVGLSTAVQFQAAYPDAVVTVVAEKFDVDTTSDGAAGVFRPTLSKTPGVPIDTVLKWLKCSWKHYTGLAHSPEARDAGVQILTCFQLYDNKEENVLEKEVMLDYRHLSREEVDMFPGKKYKKGFRCTTIMAECRRYLPYLLKRFKENGGAVIKRRLTSLDEFVGNYDLVFNCAGIGSRSLLNDNKLKPIKGQLLRMHAPWIKNCYMAGDAECVYIYPGADNVVVGGTREVVDDLDTTPSKEDTKRILDRACEVIPSLRKARLLWEWVGFRPHREPLRLEHEHMNFANGKINVIHNYGHGAEGVSLSWGTAANAVELAREVINGNKIPLTSKL